MIHWIMIITQWITTANILILIHTNHQISRRIGYAETRLTNGGH